MTSPETITDDTPLTLAEACRLFFRDTIGPKSLRREAARGNLAIMRIGKRDYVTPASIKGMMVKKCRSEESLPGSISTQGSGSGSSGMDRTQNAQDAARAIAEGLKKRSRVMSPADSNRPSAKILPLASSSPRS